MKRLIILSVLTTGLLGAEAADLTYDGEQYDVWNYTDTNWKDGDANVSFSAGDNATFILNTPNLNRGVTSTVPVAVGDMTVDISTGNYQFYGEAVTATNFYMADAGDARFNMTNSFQNLYLNAGTVYALAGQGTLGGSGATLNFDGGELVINTGYGIGPGGAFLSALNVDAGKTGTLNVPTSRRIDGLLTGGGTFDIEATGYMNFYTGSLDGFAGTLNVLSGELRTQGSMADVDEIKVQLGTSMLNMTGANGATISWGGVSGDAGAVITSSDRATRTVNVGSSGLNETFNGSIQDGSGSEVSIGKLGTGTWTLGGSNTFSGIAQIGAGTLEITHANALGSVDSGTRVLNGGQLKVTGDLSVGAETLSLQGDGGGTSALLSTGSNTWNSPLTLEADSTVDVASGAIEFTQLDGGTMLFTKKGAGAAVFNSDGVLNKAGCLVVEEGSLSFPGSHGCNFSDVSDGTTIIKVSGGTLLESAQQFGVYKNEIIEFTGGSDMAEIGVKIWFVGLNNASGGTNYQFNVADGAAEVDLRMSKQVGQALAVSNEVNVTKTGAGTLAYDDAITYAGNTYINAGRLLVNGYQNTAAIDSVMFVNSGAVLGGTGTVYNVTVESGGTLAVGGGGILTINSNLTMNSDALAEFEYGDLVQVGGDAVLDGTLYLTGDFSAAGDSIQLFDVTGITTNSGVTIDTGGATGKSFSGWTFDAVAGTYSAAAVPEDLGTLSSEMSGSSMIFTWSAAAGYDYALQKSTNLVNGSWESIQTNIIGVTGDLSVTGELSDVTGFFRIILE